DDPHLAVRRVSDEVAVAVGQAARRVIDVARLQQGALVRPETEVELARDDEAELLVVGVAGVGSGTDAVLDAPEAEAEVVAVVDAAAHPGARLAERVVVEAPHVRIGAHPVPSHDIFEIIWSSTCSRCPSATTITSAHSPAEMASAIR